MGNVSRPLIALLVATVAFFALWVVALKPGSGTSGTSAQPSVSSYQSDVNAAKNVQKTVNGNTARQGAAESGSSAGTATTPAATAPSKPATPAHRIHHSATHRAAASGARHRTHPAPATHRSQTQHHAQRTHHARTIANRGVAPTPTARMAAVKAALTQHKVLALLFYNPAAPDDQAVKHELSTIPTHRGQVLRLAIPLNEIPSYASLLAQVPVNFSPTLVIIDRQRQASAITGFADSFEIARRISDAL